MKKERLTVLDKAEWVAYSRPATDIDYPEPWFRVIAPAEWTGEKVEKTLRDMGYDVAYVLEVDAAIKNLMADAYFCGVPVGERLLWAVASLPHTVVELPSGRKMVLPVMELGVWRRTIIFPSSYPNVEVMVHHEVDQGFHVIKISIRGVRPEVFSEMDITFYGRTYDERLGEVLSDFSPVELSPYISKKGDNEAELEIEIPVQVADLKQVSILCKLIKGLTEKLLREGYITYKTETKKGKALPEEVLEFLTPEEFQIS